MKILKIISRPYGTYAAGFVTKNILSLWDMLGIVPDKTPGLLTTNRA